MAGRATGSTEGAPDLPASLSAQLLDLVSDAVVALGCDGRIVFWNRVAEEIFGWKKSDVLGRVWSDLQFVDPPLGELRERDGPCEAGALWQGEVTVRRRDGTAVRVLVTQAPLADETGKPSHVAEVSRLLPYPSHSDGSVGLQQLAETQHLAQAGSYTRDLRTHVMEWSEGMFRIMGLAPAQRPPNFFEFFEYIHPDDRTYVAELPAQVAATREPVHFLYRVIWPDGSLHYHRGVGESVFDETGQAVRIRGTIQDVTEQKELELQLLEGQRQLRALAERSIEAREEESSRIARELHDELGQRLTALKIDLATVADSLRASGANAQCERLAAMARLLDGTIDSTRTVCAGLHPRILDELGLADAIEWQARDFEERTEIFCNLSLSPVDPRLDERRTTAVFRIFQEALTNISRHAAATEISVTMECRDGCLCLSVHDNGRGIPPGAVEAGRGLGIVGMRERALAAGGRLKIESAPTTGTTVRLCLAITAEAEAHPDCCEISPCR